MKLLLLCIQYGEGHPAGLLCPNFESGSGVLQGSITSQVEAMNVSYDNVTNRWFRAADVPQVGNISSVFGRFDVTPTKSSGRIERLSGLARKSIGLGT